MLQMLGLQVRGMSLIAMLMALGHWSNAPAQLDPNNDGNEDIVSTKKPADPLNEPVVIQVWDRQTQSLLLSITGPVGEPGFGFSIASVDDLNGDGFDDIAVGSPTAGTGMSLSGRVEVFSGIDGASILQIEDQHTIATGWFVGGVGDFDGDGMPDLLVSSHGSGIPDVDPGDTPPPTAATCNCAGTPLCRPLSTSVFSGLDGGLIATLDRLDGPALVSEVTSLGDINQDGYGDFAVTVPRAIGFNDARGYVAIFYGRDMSQAHAELIAEDADLFLVNDDPSLTHFGASLISSDHSGTPALLVTSLQIASDGSVTRDYRQHLLDPENPAVVWAAQQHVDELAGDLNGDLVVTAGDVSMILGDLADGNTQAGQSGTPFDSDANGDGNVDELDILAVIEQFGAEDVTFGVYGFHGEIAALGAPGTLPPQTYAEMYHRLTPEIEEASTASGGGGTGVKGLCDRCVNPDGCEPPPWCPNPPCEDCPNPPCGDCPNPPCEPPDCTTYICVISGHIQINEEVTATPEVVKIDGEIMWELDAEDTGGSKVCEGESELVEIPPAGLTITWIVTKPNGDVVDGSGAIASVTADICGPYSCVFKATADRECPPPDLVVAGPPVVAVLGVEFELNEMTHIEGAETVMVLPGDVELVTPTMATGEDLECSPGDPSVIDRYEFSSSSVAKFLVEPEDGPPQLLDQLVIGEGEDGLRPILVAGQAKGATTLRAIDVDGNVCGEIDVHVGGTVRVEYSSAPTVVIPVGAQRGPSSQWPENADGETDSAPPYEAAVYDSGPLPLGGAPVGSDHPQARGSIPDHILQFMQDAGVMLPRNGRFTVTLLDANGDPKPNVPIAIRSRNEFIRVVSGSPGSHSTTAQPSSPPGPTGFTLSDSEGKAWFEIAANEEEIIPNVDQGVWHDLLGILVGRDASEFEDAEIDFILDGQSIYDTGVHTFVDWVTLFENTVGDDTGLDDPLLVTFKMPVLNQAHLSLMEHILVEPQWIEPVSPFWSGWTVEVLQPHGGYATETYWVEPTYIARVAWGAMIVHQLIDGLELKIETELNQFLVPLGHDPIDVEINPADIIDVMAFCTELGLGFLPGWDLVDVIRYGFIKPVFDAENVTTADRIVAWVAFAGLVADAAYAGGPAGVGANAVTSTVKAVLKDIPASWINDAVGAGVLTAKEFFDLLFSLAAKGAPIGGTSADFVQWVPGQIAAFVNAVRRTSNSPLDLTPEASVRALQINNTHVQSRILKSEAVEGIAFTVRHARSELAEELFGSFADDVVEEAMAAIRHLDLADTALSDDAIRGVAAAVDAVGSQSPIVRELVQGTQITTERADKLFSNIHRINQESGVDGLGDAVTFLRNNRNNTNGINGVIYESTVARRFLNGEHPDAGQLRLVSSDMLPNANRLDTLTDRFAIQIKHRTATGSISPSHICGSNGAVCGAAYLDEMVAQAERLDNMLTPMLVTNRPIGPALQQLLSDRGIVWMQVAD